MDTSKAPDVSELFSAKGLVIVVSGGGSGIGKAFTAALAGSGADKIFLLGRRLEALQKAASETNPSVVIPVQCDVTSGTSLEAAVKEVAKQTSAVKGGYVDVLINNAGVSGPMATDVHTAQTVEEVAAAMVRGAEGPGDGWDAAWRTNAVAVAQTSAAFLPLLDRANRRRGWLPGRKSINNDKNEQGHVQGDVEAMSTAGIHPADRRTSQIITVSSIAAYNMTVTAGLAYTASKAGSAMLGKSMSNFLAPFGIRSNVICPGRFPSEMMTDKDPRYPVNQVPLGGTGSYDDLASLILYLVGRSGAYVNGGVHIVDGGRLSVMPVTV